MNIYGWIITIALVSFFWALWSYKREVRKDEHHQAKKHLAKERVIFQSSN